ncbi:efflux RND transporter permease subunit [Sphingomonas sp. CGMCC 1.13654]|uniref:Efflux pump membrane transporter n=1 Tax=Sphingomonas chungangi TaxID=2683589 RepID=A0A838LC13_9SPHN|nr:efflux RND transporter permease subunit [Sphingomonas chungangi]MBA2935018.1 efflux RND transporter permease subunit [Sphingomonas chungangi]MVW54133.1 efflux RND transporter permease subunit [Sphingomonas chungangi]
MISRYFIQRPIFAWVIAIVIMLAGIGALTRLPIEQYPDISPPTVGINATYPGASAEVLEDSVTQVIEQQLTGLDGLLYFQSTSSDSGTVTITVTFANGTNPDIAQVQVQNKVQQALPRLPQQVQQQGLTVQKRQPDYLLIVGLYDSSDQSTSADVADFMVSKLQDPLSRVNGVGEVDAFGTQYAMRVWLDPFKLNAHQLMPSDVTNAIEAQNVQVGAGLIGAQPSAPGQELNATVTAQSRLTTPQEFRDIILKTETDGSVVRLSDVARVELGQEQYTSVSRYDAHPAAGLAVSLAPGADALKTSEAVRAKVQQLSDTFPAGYKVAYVRDSTDFIKLSVAEVEKTLIEAIILVVIVMYVFLQSWRATLIPAIAVPVVLLGTFGILAAAGYSVNTLTLFGMVLAIGLLVDDAIVVVENVERIMEEEKLSPYDATAKSMEEISGALIGIAMVLSAVFLPMAFFGGSTGTIYRQFSITIVSSMVLSVIVALILTPALTSTLLKPKHEEEGHKRDNVFTRTSDRFFGWFNRTFDKGVNKYQGGVGYVIERTRWFMIAFVGVVALLGFLFIRLPTGFLPTEDIGQAIVQYFLPAGATQDRTNKVSQAAENYFLHKEGDVQDMFANTGRSFSGTGDNTGQAFLLLKPWDDRKGSKNSAQAVVDRAQKAMGGLRDARVLTVLPPAIRGLGQTNGFTLEIQNQGNLSREDFAAAKDKIIAEANQDPILDAVRLGSLEDTPHLHIDVDEAKVGALGLAQADVNSTLSAGFGGTYVNDFIDRGRVKRVYIQGDAPYRGSPEDLADWHVRSTNGTMAPFSSFSTTSWTKAPSTLQRFNGVSSYEIQGQASASSSSGAAMDEIQKLAEQVPGIGTSWSGLSYQERLSTGQAPYLYALSVLVIFLCLAALYESWSIPISVLMVIPLGVIGAVLAVMVRGLDNDIYFQVGLLTTIGLSAKNAILIVEFAEFAEERGKTPMEAAMEAAKLRLRPILMTSLAFVAGVIPLAIATGAGAQSRVAIGTAVVGGMITATSLAIFFVPMFFVLVRWLFTRGGHKGHSDAALEA